MVSILILTKNEQQDLPGCLDSVRWCDDVHVYDSFSTDKTLEIAATYQCHVTQRVFDNWAAHQNWAMSNLPFRHPWVLYIDADERVSEGLRDAILNFDYSSTPAVAFNIQRRDFAWNNRWLKYTQISPFYLRLFQPGKMRYERLVNPVSIPDGPVANMKGYLDHFPFSKGILFWLQRHIGYANLEAQMRMADISENKKFSVRKALFGKDFSEKRYHQKGLFYKMPGRPFIKFFYMVVWRRAFMDGGAGVTYATLQSIYEYFIVLRSREIEKKARP